MRINAQHTEKQGLSSWFLILAWGILGLLGPVSLHGLLVQQGVLAAQDDCGIDHTGQEFVCMYAFLSLNHFSSFRCLTK